MTYKQAIKKIVSNWEELNKKNPDNWSKPKSVAVWCAKSDIAGSYEVDEEWIGVSPQGNMVWAYASGCSCWVGDFDEQTKPTMKEFVLNHKHTNEDWEKAVVAFVETGVLQYLPSYNRYE